MEFSFLVFSLDYLAEHKKIFFDSVPYHVHSMITFGTVYMYLQQTSIKFNMELKTTENASAKYLYSTLQCKFEHHDVCT
jgi:hypothetical protein